MSLRLFFFEQHVSATSKMRERIDWPKPILPPRDSPIQALTNQIIPTGPIGK
jgi:hypothetical protein